ncbi:protein crumbs homolog 1-like [Zingiber officinale]|uniref:protein crumbs homolog 1-like n=1 Tax=Zingiber officinale TaxID=94328 RepID=UPI001C4C3A4E|nr:protein crumbs homolog 1-like [Zingiber officinale]
MDRRPKVEVVVLTLLALLQFLATSHRADAGNPLAPLLQPLFGNMCNRSTQCGRGTCEESSDVFFGYVCNCDRGWSQFHVGESFRFLPCVVPNCSLNYKCFNDSGTPATPPESPRFPNISNICSVAYCGGGQCVQNSTFGYHCDCHEGYNNLLNSTNLPCYRDCSLGADCSDLGITLNNSSSSSPPSLSDNGGNPSGGGMFAPNSYMWIGSFLGISIMALVG